MRLTVTPNHIAGESLIGYLLRLAKRNGYMHIKDLVASRFVDAAVRNDIKKLQSALPNILFNNPEGYVESGNALWKNLRSIRPKVCVNCLRDQGLIKEEHLLGTTHRCSQHNQLLISCCQRCGQPLKWDVSLIEARCTNPHCGCHLKPTENDKLYTSAQIVDGLIAHSFLTNSTTTYLKQETFINTYRFHDDVIRGIAFLNDKEAVSNWLNEQYLKAPATLPKNIKAHAFTILKSSLTSDWKGVEGDLRQSARLDTTSHETTHYFLNANWACRLLQVSQEELTSLNTLGLVETLTRNRLNANSIVNVMPLFERLHGQSTQNAPHYTRLSHLEVQLGNHLTTVGDVIRFIHDKELPFHYSPDKSFLESIWVDEQTLTRLCQRLLNTKHDDLISLEQASRISKIRKTNLISARKRGLLPPPRWHRGNSENMYYCGDVMKLSKMRNDGQMELTFD